MQLTVARKIRLGFVFACLVLLLGGIATLYSTLRWTRTTDAVRHTNEVLEELDRTRTLILDDETGTRGFALTGRDDFLQPHDTAQRQLPEALRSLQRLTADNPSQQQRLDRLEPLIRERLAISEEYIATRRTRGLDAAASLMSAGRGKAATDLISGILDDMRDEESHLLLSRTMADDTAALRIVAAQASVVLLAVALVVLALLLLNQLITRPISRLMEGLKRQAAGDLSVRLDSTRQDEFGELSAAFNEMAEKRQRAKEELMEAKSLLDGLFQASPVAIVAIDATGRVDVWNPAAERTFGYSASEVIGRSLQVIPESERQEFQQVRRRVLDQGEVIRIEAQRRRKDGTLFDARSFVAPRLKDGRSLGMMAIVDDITEEKRAAEALRASEQRLAHELQVAVQLQHISARFVRDGNFNALIDDIVETAIATTQADMGCLQMFDRATQRMTLVTQRGFSPAWVAFFKNVAVGQRTAGGRAMERRERVVVEDVATSELFADTPAREVQLREGVRAVQSTPLFGRSGEIIGMLTTHHRVPTRPSERNLALLDLLASQVAEMLERAEAEQSLQESENQLKRAQQIAHLGSWELDLQASRLTWSDEVYRIFGLAPQEFGATYEAFLEAVHPDDRAAVDAAYTSSLREGRDSYEIEHRVVQRSTGEVRLVHERCEHLRDPSGRIIRSLGTVHDITERKRIEQTLRESEERFRLTFDEAPIGMALVDVEGRFLRVNQMLCRIVGYTAEELVRMTFQELTPPEEVGIDLANMGRSLRQEIPRYQREKHYIRKGGALVDVRINAALIRGRDGEPLHFIAQIEDITERKRAQDALKASEERLRGTLDDMLEGCMIIGCDWRYLYVNPSAARQAQQEAKNLIGRTMQEMYPGVEKSEVFARYRHCMVERVAGQFESPFTFADGTTRWYQFSVEPVPEGIFVLTLDITERKRAEAALQQSEAKFSGIISLSEDAIISVDASQRITLFNRGAEKIFGYPHAEALGRPLEMLLPARLHALHHQKVAEFATGDVRSRRMGERAVEIFGRRRNGEEFPAEASISRLEVGGQQLLNVALRDITERRRFELEQRLLAESGVTLAGSLDIRETVTSVARLVVRELAELCVVDVANEQGELERMAVVSADSAKAETCEQLVRMPLDRNRPHLAAPVLKTGKPLIWDDVTPPQLAQLAQSPERYRLVQELNPRSGVAVPLLVHGEIRGVLSFTCSRPHRYGPRDVALAEELARRLALALENAWLYQRARRATQARDDVLGVVAHDLRNPLMAIQLAATVLERQLAESGSPRGLKSVETIHRSLQRSQRLIQDLLDVTRMEAGQLSVKKERLPTPQLVYDAVEAQQLLASSASIELRLDVEEDLPDLWGDRDRLLQVIENLIGNAVRFTPAGGSITLGAEPRAGEVLFRVADTGSGVPPDHLPHLFERFWRAKREEKSGAGLGLPICKGIVEAHGGRIWAESTPGRGTTFYFSVPTAPAVAEQPQEMEVVRH